MREHSRSLYDTVTAILLPAINYQLPHAALGRKLETDTSRQKNGEVSADRHTQKTCFNPFKRQWYIYIPPFSTLISSVFYPHSVPMCIIGVSQQSATRTDKELWFWESVKITIQAEVPARPAVYGWFPFQYHNIW